MAQQKNRENRKDPARQDQIRANQARVVEHQLWSKPKQNPYRNLPESPYCDYDIYLFNPCGPSRDQLARHWDEKQARKERRRQRREARRMDRDARRGRKSLWRIVLGF